MKKIYSRSPSRARKWTNLELQRYKSWSVGGGMMQLPTFIWHDLGLTSEMVIEGTLNTWAVRLGGWQGICDFGCWTLLTGSEHRRFWGCTSAWHYNFFCACFFSDLILPCICNTGSKTGTEVVLSNFCARALPWLTAAYVALQCSEELSLHLGKFPSKASAPDSKIDPETWL